MDTIALVATFTVAITCLSSGFAHVRNVHPLTGALKEAGFGRFASAIARIVAATELGVGAIILAAVEYGTREQFSLAMVAAVYLFGAYTAYTSTVLRWRPGARCGCQRAERPVNFWSVMRAAFLCLAALGALLHTRSEPGSSRTITLSVLMAAVLALAIAVLPDSMHIPGRNGASDKYAAMRS